MKRDFICGIAYVALIFIGAVCSTIGYNLIPVAVETVNPLIESASFILFMGGAIIGFVGFIAVLSFIFDDVINNQNKNKSEED